MLRNKARETEQRQMELKLATMSTANQQGLAAQRKAANIQGSNMVGLPGAAATAGRGPLGVGMRDGMDPISAAGISAPGMGRMGSMQRGGSGAPWEEQGGYDQSMVNMGTMPAGGGGTYVNMGTMPSAATQQRMQQQQRDRDSVGGQTMYEQYENRPIRASGGGGGMPRGGGGRGGRDDDDGVMMGTVGGGGTMVNMGTMNVQVGPCAPVLHLAAPCPACP
jgi:hypothetical protein